MPEKEKDDPSSEMPLATALIIVILMLVFGAASSKGMYQFGCKTNANALMYFLYNICNSLLFGIPGLISAIHFKDTTFVAVKPS